MKTVKEISDFTGISVRALRYYDEIGLLTPSKKSEAGYRLYDDKAMEKLQQILFFREFDISLKEIKAVMDNPVFDKDKTLQMQRKMLAAKKERLERLITSIDDILRGENKMNFEVFNKSEIEELCQTTMDHMPDFMQQSIVQEFGGMNQWKKHYIERASKEDMQQGYQKLIEWYGSKETALKGQPLDSFAIKQLIGEYSFVMKQFFQTKHEKDLMLSIASSYKNEMSKSVIDQKYGSGAADFFTNAIELFYRNE